MSSTQKLSIAALFALTACGTAERPLTGKLDLAAFGRTGATLVAVRDDGVIKTAEVASDGSFEISLAPGHSHALAFRGEQRGRTATFANLVFKTESGRRSSSLRCEDGDEIELGELHPEDSTDDDHSSCRGLPDDDDAPDGGTTTGTTSTDDTPGSDTPGTDDDAGAGDPAPEILLFTSALVSGDTVSDDLAGDDHGTDSPLNDSDDDDRPDALDDDEDDDGVCNDDDEDHDDDHGGHGDEPGDDHGDDGDEPGDDHGDDGDEPGDDNGGHGDEPGDDNGGNGDEPGDDNGGNDGGSSGGDAEESDLPYDVRLSVGDTFALEDAFLSEGPLPASIVSVEMDGGSWRLAELQSGTRFTVTEADCTHEGNRDVGRDRIFVAWVNADGSTELDHLDLRYCGR